MRAAENTATLAISHRSVRFLAATLLIAGTIVLGLFGGFAHVRAGAGPGVGAAQTTVGLSPSSSQIAFPTPIQHVVIVLLENAEASTVLSQGPFEMSLSTTYSYANESFAVCHPSEPNYLALAAGDTFGRCGTDAYTVISATNVADLIEQRGETWAEFAESMPVPCDTTDSGLYAVRHNPFVFFQDIVSNASRCDSHVLNFDAWNASVQSGTVPNFSFITPNLKNDGHDTGVAFADAWLHGWITPLLTKPWFASTAFIVTYDEGASHRGFHMDGTHLRGGQIYTTVVSPFTLPGVFFTPRVSHYNTLTTIEWLLGLGSTGHHDNATSFPPMTGMFHFATALVLELDALPIARAADELTLRDP